MANEPQDASDRQQGASESPGSDQRPPDRSVDLESLKAFAHPLRVQIYDILSQYGPATASGLGERLGESSGATSYHLRQLARHGFVQEVTGRGTARERWWERPLGGINVETRKLAETPAGRVAAQSVLRQWNVNRAELLNAFVDHGLDLLPPEWTDASTVGTANIRLTAEQLAEVTAEWVRFSTEFLDRFRGQNPPGSRPVQIHFNAFPLIDGEETPK